MKKYLAGAGVAAALVGGSVAVAAISPIGFAGAQDTTTTETPSTEAPAPEAPAPEPPSTEAPPAEAPDAGPHEAGHGPLSESLDELVAEGVITQDQADAIRDRVEQNRQEWMDEHPRMGPGFGGLRESTEAIAGALGITTEELHQALRDGKSLNDLAAEKGVDPAVISQILVDAANTRIDGALAEGKITQEQADEAKAKIAEGIGKVMDGSMKDFGGRGPGGRGPGHGHGPGHGDQGEDGTSSESGGA